MTEQINTIGIVAVGTYSPKKAITAAEIAEVSGLPEWVISDKLGIKKICWRARRSPK